MWSFIIYIVCQILGYRRTVAKWGKECGMRGNEGNFQEILDWKRGGKESFQKACVNMGG